MGRNVGGFPGDGVGRRGCARQARRASITGGDRSGQREESTIQRRDRSGTDLYLRLASGKSLWYGPYPSGKREETTATREFRRFYGFFVSMILSIKLIRSFPATSTFRSARIAPMIGF